METPKMWDDVGSQLQAMVFEFMPRIGVPEFMRGEGLDIEGTIERLFELESGLRERVDGMARGVAASRCVLATASPEMYYLLFLRMQCANDFAGQVFLPQSAEDPFGPPPDHWTEGDLMSWLLVDLWNRKADSYLKLVALELASRFPFYGIDPVDPDLNE